MNPTLNLEFVAGFILGASTVISILFLNYGK